MSNDGTGLRERNTKVIRISWVSEVQSDAGRRALLMATYPVFLARGIAASIIKPILYAVLILLICPLRNIIRCAQILTYSMRLRWTTPKPKGADDWVVSAVDDYVDRLDMPKAAIFTAWTTEIIAGESND